MKLLWSMLRTKSLNPRRVFSVQPSTFVDLPGIPARDFPRDAGVLDVVTSSPVRFMRPAGGVCFANAGVASSGVM